MGPCFGQEGNFLFSPLSLRSWAGPSTSTQAQPRPRLARLIDWKFTGLQNVITEEGERSQPSSTSCPLTPRKPTLPRGLLAKSSSPIFRALQARVWERPQGKRRGLPTATLRVQDLAKGCGGHPSSHKIETP